MKKNFFQSNASLDHHQSEHNGQGQLDSQNQTKQGACEPQQRSSVNSMPNYDLPNNKQNANNDNYAESYMNNKAPDNENVVSSGNMEYYVPLSNSDAITSTGTRKKTGLIIALVVAVVLVIGCGGFFAYTYHQDQVAKEEKVADDQAAAQTVVNQIASIGEVSLGSGDALIEARSAYDALTVEQKEYVSNISTLTSAERKYETMAAEDKAKTEAEQAAKAQKEAAAAAAKEIKKNTLVTPSYNDYYGCYQVSANGGLVLRYGPSKSYGKILTIPNGSYLDVYAVTGGWCFVEYDGSQGWVSGDYLY